VVVALGVTDLVPPAAASVNELPSLPLTVTDVALAAVTVSVEEPPASTEVGLALMLTVGELFVLPELLLHPVNSTVNKRLGTTNDNK
jgi:hypothetical protein